MLRLVTFTATKAAAIALFVTALFFVANYYSLGRGGAERIPQAFASGALGDDDFPRGDALRGYHQYNDCLILGMAIDQRYSAKELTVSPSVPFATGCQNLRPGRPYLERFFYHNYVHGHTTLVRYLLPVLGVEQIRNIYRLLLTFVIITGLAVSLLRRDWVFAIVLAAFARCFGLEVFGQSLSHAPSDIILTGYVSYLAFKAGSLSPRSAIVAASVFGSLTMIFEFMTGGLPLGLSAVFLTWFALKDRNLPTLASSGVAYLTAAAVTLAAKYAAVAAVFGPGAIIQISRSLEHRSLGATPQFMAGRSFFQSLIGNTEAMMPGLGPMAGLLVILAIGLGALGLMRRPTLDSKILALSNLPVVAWFVVFHQHTIIHGWFMDRMLAWPMATGFAIYGFSAILIRPSLLELASVTEVAPTAPAAALPPDDAPRHPPLLPL